MKCKFDDKMCNSNLKWNNLNVNVIVKNSIYVKKYYYKKGIIIYMES